MSAPASCCSNCCPTTVTVNTPGVQGTTGPTGPIACMILDHDPTGVVADDYDAGTFAFDTVTENLYIKTASGNVMAWTALITT